MSDEPVCCNRLCKNSLKMQTDAQWDHELGSWKGRAPSLHVDEMKSPLYVFGYGSLIWRPGDVLGNFQSFPATATKYKRLFAQKSMDHRGNCKFPGLVLNLVKDDYLEEKGYAAKKSETLSHSLENQSDCFGLVWLIPDHRISEVLEYLDEREKGGYSRHYLHVQLLQETPHYPAKSIIDAVVYTGLENNPNFFLPKLSTVAPNLGFSDLQDRSEVVDIIAAARGLSGTNIEYLLKLQRYLEEKNMADTYINRLAAAVRMRMGTWRRRAIMNNILAAIPSTVRRNVNPDALPLTLFGIGSNEMHQLHNEHNDLDVAPKDIYFYISKAFADLPGFSNVEWGDTERHSVFAAGANSAYLYDGRLAVWGALATKLLTSLGCDNVQKHEKILVIDGVEGVALGYDTLLLLLPSGWVASLGTPLNEAPTSFVLPKESFRLRPVEIESMKPFQFKQNSHKEAHGSSQGITRFEIDVFCEEYMMYKPSLRIEKISLGLKVAAAITHCGGLVVWGTPNSGIDHDVNVPWYPPPPTDDFFVKNSTDCSSTSNTHLSKCIDVACGSYHVIAIDDEGRVFAYTDAKYLKKVQKYGSMGDYLPLRREDSDYSGRDSFHLQQQQQMQGLHLSFPPRVSISEGASTSLPRYGSFANSSTASTGTSTPIAATGAGSSSLWAQYKPVRLEPSSLAMNQVLLPRDVRFMRATVGWSHTIVRGIKNCGEVVCYAWGRQDMSQYQVSNQEQHTVLSAVAPLVPREDMIIHRTTAVDSYVTSKGSSDKEDESSTTTTASSSSSTAPAPPAHPAGNQYPDGHKILHKPSSTKLPSSPLPPHTSSDYREEDTFENDSQHSDDTGTVSTQASMSLAFSSTSKSPTNVPIPVCLPRSALTLALQRPTSLNSLATTPTAMVSSTTTTATTTTTTTSAAAAASISSAVNSASTKAGTSSSSSNHATTGSGMSKAEVDRDASQWYKPGRLLPLPNQRTIAEVWCGSEFTVVMDAETSSLWAMGWNEHGNLGHSSHLSLTDNAATSPSSPSSPSPSLSHALPLNAAIAQLLVTEDHQQLQMTNRTSHDDAVDIARNAVLQAASAANEGHSSHLPIISQWQLLKIGQSPSANAIQVAVFDGSVACGGAHVLCLQRPLPVQPVSDEWSSWCI